MIKNTDKPLSKTKSGNSLKPLLNDVFLGSYKDYIPLIEDKSLDLVITDPPYWHKKVLANHIVKEQLIKLKANLQIVNYTKPMVL